MVASVVNPADWGAAADTMTRYSSNAPSSTIIRWADPVEMSCCIRLMPHRSAPLHHQTTTLAACLMPVRPSNDFAFNSPLWNSLCNFEVL